MSKHATQTVLENVKVLAIDQNAAKDDANKAKVGRTVTLKLMSICCRAFGFGRRNGRSVFNSSWT